MPERKLSIAEPVTQLRHVKIIECGEPLVDFTAFCPRLLLDLPRFNYRRETLLRQSVAEQLCRAAELLPEGYRLSIIEGWRPPYIQRRMYLTTWGMFEKEHPDWSRTRLVRTVNRFTAPMDRRVPPPHTTGGAVDLSLTDADGRPVEVLSPYASMDPEGFLFAAPRLSPEARRHRDILAEALTAGGLTNYPSEYWHWSYGDQGWAYRGGHQNALYGPVQPPGWEPAPEDVAETPLVWNEELLERDSRERGTT
jgi:D-alanyl-D-alanine dipeptidase